MRVTLRDYQQTAVDQIRAAYSHGRRSVLFCLPTGGGKTVVFCYVAEAAAAKGKRIVILVHRQELVSQSVQSLQALGLEVGVIAPGEPERPDLPIQVASVQSLARRLNRWADAFDFLVIDECHHTAAGSWQKVIEAFPKAHRLGVTATPERLDGKALRPWFDELICGPGTWELMQAGHLAPCKILCPPTGTDFKKLRVLGGDFRKDDAAEAMAKATLMGDVVGHYKKHLAPATAIAFCVTVAHAESLAAQFQAAGVRAAVIDGTLSTSTRRDLIDGLRTGEVQVLCSCEVISEGTDVPSGGGAILCRPTNSLSLFLQQVGRCLRPAVGKAQAVVLDHAGNVARHGLPQDVRAWSLDGAKIRQAEEKRPDAPWVTVCSSCFAAIPGGGAPCPYCGAEPMKAKPKPAGIMGEGELREIRVEDALIRIREKEEKRRQKNKQSQARSLAELQALAKERGYSPGWAYHIHKSRSQRGRFL